MCMHEYVEREREREIKDEAEKGIDRNPDDHYGRLFTALFGPTMTLETLYCRQMSKNVTLNFP